MSRISRRFLHFVRSRPRLWGSVLAGLLVWALLPLAGLNEEGPRFLLAWNAAVLLFLALMMVLMTGADARLLRRRASEQDVGQIAVLAFTLATTLISLVAVVIELPDVKALTPGLRALHLGLAALTVVSSWLFMHTMFAQHYAHVYTLEQARCGHGGLAFPGSEAPDYWDFMYFACVIGTSGQTADVSFESRPLRRVGLAHCIASYFFNITVVAMAINLAAGLF
ncbi:DUF1345 domain-containing protein [Amphibiibacter pelophylacis]|uniref:DUF1345 domain-containing protein n=1 Tax=Amphibiibacter pelophylacis TaxID=1799477 RepID=A0ACC6P0R0_9BURK